MTGTWTLVGLMLRRDRLRLALWSLGIGAFWLYCTRLVPEVYGDDLEGAAGLMSGPMGRMVTGPAHGFDDLTIDRFLVGAYGLYLLLLSALMSLLLLVRHTRAEEQAGRADLVRANVVGRYAPLTAAFVVVLVANLLAAAAVLLVSATSPELGGTGVWLLAAGVLLAGLSFGGIAAVTAQITQSSRAAAGLAGGALGLAFVVRALGDMQRSGGTWVSWCSPLAWPQQTGPFSLDRWGPLALSLALTGAATSVAVRLTARRDVGGSLTRQRPGPARAAAWLRSPVALSVRLQRASIIGWGASLATMGLIYGLWTDAMLTSFDDLPDVLIDVLGGEEDIIGGYLGLIALLMALSVAVYAVLAVMSLHHEETSGRAEPLLAAPVSRWAWCGGHLAVTAVGVMVLLVMAGLATGLGAYIVTGSAHHLVDATVAHLAYTPAVLLVLGLAIAVFGHRPGAVGLTWLLLVYGVFAGMFGQLMDLPRWVLGVSPFEHVPRLPVDTFDVLPLVVLGALAAAIAALGLAGARRRDLDVT